MVFSFIMVYTFAMYRRDKMFMVVIIGTSGAGKTTLAEFLKNQLANTAHVAYDNIKSFVSQFKEVYSHKQTSVNVTYAMTKEYFKNNISVIVDKNMTNEEVDKYKEIAEKYCVDFFLYRVEIHEDIRKERITKRAYKENKPIPSQETLDKFSETYNKNIHQSNTTFDSGVLSIEQMANFILKDLGVLKD